MTDPFKDLPKTDEQLLADLYWRCDPHGPAPNTLALEIWEHLRSVMLFPPEASEEHNVCGHSPVGEGA